MADSKTMQTNRSDFNFDFMAIRKPAMAVSIALILLSIISLATRGLNFGIDFTGGYLIEMGYEKPVEDLNIVRKQLTDSGIHGAIVQYFGSSRDVLVRLMPIEGTETTDADATKDAAKVSDKILSVLQTNNVQVNMRRVEYVGPQVGDELVEQGGLAVLYAMICIFIYIMFRFEKKFSAGAVIALVHDVIITVGVFAFTQADFDLTVIAALLAVIGYSLNDTIVIFDRIRENFRKMRKGTPFEITNISVNETLSRSFMTSFATLLVVIALYFWGGEIIHSFALALIVGIVVGTYSSVFIASPITLALGLTREDLLLVKKEETDGVESQP